jgi:mRNA interferase MazF
LKVGDIHWVEFPAADGHEQRGRRPGIVLQDDDVAGGLPVVLVVPLTTAVGTLRFPGTTDIQSTPENGLSPPLGGFGLSTAGHRPPALGRANWPSE